MIDVSVIIPAHNVAATLERAVKSVRAQHMGTIGLYRQSLSDDGKLTEPNRDWLSVEIIIIDDGSTDETLRLASWLTCKCISFPESRGAAAARNRGIQEAEGRYIAFLDADDEWTDREKLLKQVRYLDDHPRCGIVGTQWRVESSIGTGRNALHCSAVGISPHARQAMTLQQWEDSVPRMPLLKPRRVTYTELLRECCMLTSSVMARRDTLLVMRTDHGRPFDETLMRGQDYDLWLRKAGLRLGEIHVLPDVSVTYHKHDSAATRRPLRRCYEAEILERITRVAGRGDLSHSELQLRLANAWSDHAWAHIQRGSRLTAITSALRSLWHWPSLGTLRMLARSVMP